MEKPDIDAAIAMIVGLSDRDAQRLVRLVQVDDLTVIMSIHADIKAKVFPNVKMTTRMWLAEQITVLTDLSPARVAAAEANVAACVVEVSATVDDVP